VSWSVGAEPSIGANPLNHKPLLLRSGFWDVLRHVSVEILEGENRARFGMRQQDYCQILRHESEPQKIGDPSRPTEEKPKPAP
jgi:hypothetical protein